MKPKDKLAYLFWLIFAFVLFPLSLLKRDKLKKILIFPQRKIGDFVAQVPLFREIKRNYPCVSVEVVLLNHGLKELIKCNPFVDKIFLFKEDSPRIEKIKFLFRLLSYNYDCAINLTFQNWLDFFIIYVGIPLKIAVVPEKLSLFFRIFYSLFRFRLVYYNRGMYSTEVYLNTLRYIGIKNFQLKRQIYLCQEDRTFAEEFLKKIPVDKEYLIGISLSCGNKLKEWPQENFVLLVQKLLNTQKTNILLFVFNKEKDLEKIFSHLNFKDKIFIVEDLDLGKVGAIIEKLNLFISVDTGLLYIANALGVPVIDIAGPVEPKEQIIIDEKTKVIQAELDCLPCSFVVYPARICKLGRRDCLYKITAEDVFLKVKELLKI